MAYVQLPPFPNDVSVAKIATVDYDDLVQGDKAASQTLYEAATGYGFFYLKNHHVDSQFMFELADETLNLPFDELIKYDVKFSDGGYFGYKVAGDQVVDEKGTADCSQFYNVSKDDILRISNHPPLEHPSPINSHKTELELFIRSCHEVAMAVSRALSRELGLDPDLIPRLHQIGKTSGDTARVTHAPPISADTIALGEHCDFGSVTVLFNQLGGLQVLEPHTRDWKYVKPQPPDAIINLGDAMVKFTGDRLYAGVHRVVGPRGDQATMPRHSVGYFCRPNSDVKLQSLFEGEADGNAMTADEWIAHRTRNRATANYTGPETVKASRGMEHFAEAERRGPKVEESETASAAA